MRILLLLNLVGAAACATMHDARALDIPAGDYSKNAPAYVPVMTFNVLQHLGDPTRPTTAWTPSQIGSPLSAINLIVAALDPDILLLQEVGDIDNSIPFSTAQAELLAWRNINRPGFSVTISNESGGNIHNAILSRWPFGDLNGDGRTVSVDIPSLSPGPGGYPAGGDGGIRGWLQAEINLPDATYPGNLYVGCSHFKALSGFDSERIAASKNIAAYIQYALNTTGDPLNVIPNASQPPVALDSLTPVIWGGDFNNVDAITPMDILRSNDPGNATDGTDRDGGNAYRSEAATAFNGTTWTQTSQSRIDWIFAQDSIARVDAQFIFDTTRMPFDGNLQITQGAPPNMVGLLENARISAFASDHRPVVVDFEMPATVVLSSVTITGVSTVTSGGFAQYQGVAHFSNGSQQTVTSQGTWSITGPAAISPLGLLTANTVAFDSSATVMFSYMNGGITKDASKAVTIVASCGLRGDMNQDGSIDGADIGPFVKAVMGLEAEPSNVCRANVVNDAVLDAQDVASFTTTLLN